MTGWHWLKDDGTLRDGRPAPDDGKWLAHDGDLVMCESGLHWSRRITDARKRVFFRPPPPVRPRT